ncbi:glycoside hydrolase family 3 C-terminal domain-containing protein [Paenibacillus sp. CC-CFT747]|nr:glycoside hydrolase family 3 C-terminal domain-containing protein [Paenibacillus sp. CC-CFT747]
MEIPRLLALTALVLTTTASPYLNTASAAGTDDHPWMNKSLPAEKRTALLLKNMTLDEKVSFVTGDVNNFFGFYNKDLSRLGIPALTMADGPAGVRIADPNVQDKKSTALPAPIALAATWDTAAAKKYGTLIGSEAFNTTHNVILGPGLDIARLPWGARNFESLGEDPLLQSKLASEYVNGVQTSPVIATAKHYLANNQETERFTTNANVSERAIQEVYARPFAAAIKDAHLGSVMCSFNKINGESACENKTLLTDVLKKGLGFQGFVMSDYGANLSTVASAKAGLDIETPGDPFGLWGAKLKKAVDDGQISETLLDDKASRILTQMFQKGLFDNPVQNVRIPAQKDGAAARQLAEESMVLLQNRSQTLPLKANELKSLAVIGPDADNASAAGGGSSLVLPTYTVSPLEGITNRAGKNVKVSYAPGTDPISSADVISGPSAVPSAVLAPPGAKDGQTGLKAEFWTNASMNGEPKRVNVDPQVNMNLGFYNFGGFNAQSPKLPVIPGVFNGTMSARWTGSITAPKSGSYKLSLTALGSSELYLDGKLLVKNEGKTLQTIKADVELKEGEKHNIRMEYRTDSPSHSRLVGAQIRFGWEPPADTVDSRIQEAVNLAKKSDAAVIVTRTYDAEGFVDRSDLDLPNNQERLIQAVAKANPKTVVVSMSGRAVQMDGWKSDVNSIVQAWFAGQEQGNAIARVLFGDVNPSGKLPVTFPVNEDQTPVSTKAQFPGVNGEGSYSEGVFVGYKGYEKEGLTPAFPFGHGLSYTTFDYRNLKVKVSNPNKDKSSSDPDVQVSLHLRNTGGKAGSEVVQVYAGKLPTQVDTPAKQLAGFAKVTLSPGKQTKVDVKLDPKALSYWDEKTHQWVTPSGEVPIYVGSSSSDIRLEGKVKNGK